MTKSKLIRDFLTTLMRLSLISGLEASGIYKHRYGIRGLDVNKH
jgi:hypothetical protein